MHVPLSEYDRILNLWKDKESEYFSFKQIKGELEKQGWYERKIVRYLNKMVFALGLLEKKEEGIRTYYKPTETAHEFEATSFFERIRQACEKNGRLIEEFNSFHIYGIPPKSELEPFENEILNNILNRIEESFSDLYFLKGSIAARLKVRQPTDYSLARNYLMQKIVDALKDRLESKIRREGGDNEIAYMLDWAKDNQIEIKNSDTLLDVEKNWISPKATKVSAYSKGLWDDFDSAYLAIRIMPSPEMMEEYALDPRTWLKEYLLRMMEDGIPLTDGNIIKMAEDFLCRMKHRRESLTEDDIKRLRNWPWLRLKIGAEATEKLVKIIYYLWQKEKEETTKKKKEQQMKPVKPEFHIITEEERNQEIRKIIQESQKIDLDSLKKNKILK